MVFWIFFKIIEIKESVISIILKKECVFCEWP